MNVRVGLTLALSSKVKVLDCSKLRLHLTLFQQIFAYMSAQLAYIITGLLVKTLSHL